MLKSPVTSKTISQPYSAMCNSVALVQHQVNCPKASFNESILQHLWLAPYMDSGSAGRGYSTMSSLQERLHDLVSKYASSDFWLDYNCVAASLECDSAALFNTCHCTWMVIHAAKAIHNLSVNYRSTASQSAGICS